MLIFKNGMFFEMFISCLFNDNDNKNNEIRFFISTILTVYYYYNKGI
jgi:hypothetical protein